MERRLPVISGRQAVKAFCKLGYAVVRQRGSHIRLEHKDDKARKSITIPDHKELGRGLLRKLLRDTEITLDDLMKLL